jgi:hypothetical protein
MTWRHRVLGVVTSSLFLIALALAAGADWSPMWIDQWIDCFAGMGW